MGAPGSAPLDSDASTLVGRREQTLQLRLALMKARTGKGSALVVTGPGGIGKTRLLRWLAEEGVRHGFAVRWGYCLNGVSTPFFAFEQLLPEAGASGASPGQVPKTKGPGERGRPSSGPRGGTGDDIEGSPEDGEEAREGARVPSPASPASPASSSLPPTVQAAPSLALLRLREEFRAASVESPLLLLIDDLQWADPQSLLAFQFLSRNLSDLRIVLAGATREDDGAGPQEGSEHSVQGVLEHLARDHALQRVPLTPLLRSEVRRMVVNHLRGPLSVPESEPALEKLTERSGGVPYFVSELLRQLQEDGAVEHQRNGWRIRLPEAWRSPTVSAQSQRAPIPPAIRRLLRGRLVHLPRDQRNLLDVASVVGPRFDLLPVGEVAGLHRGTAELAARRMVDRGPLLLPPGPSDRSWSFSHPLLWEVVLHDLPVEELRRIARELGEWWERHRPTDIGRIAALFHEAHDLRKGPHWVRRALEHARKTRAFEQVTTYLAWLRELLKENGTAPALIAEEQLLVADAVRADGGQMVARHILEGLNELALPPSLRGEVLVRLADVTKQIDPEESRSILTELESGRLTGGVRPSGGLLGRIRVVQSFLHTDRLELQENLAKSEEALALLGPKGDPYEQARALSYRATALANLGRYEEAVATVRRSGAVALAAGFTGLVEQARMTEAFMLLEQGHASDAYEGFSQGVAMSRRSGHIPAVVYGLVWGSLALLEMGRIDEARGQTEEGEALARQFGLPRYVAAARGLLAEIAFRSGDFPLAIRSAKAAIGLYEGFGEAEVQPVRSTLLRALVAKGDLAGAKSELVRLLPHLEEPMSVHSEAPRFLLAVADVLEASSDAKGSRLRLEEARRIAHERCAPLSEADALLSLAAWEDRHGTPVAALTHRAEAEGILRPLGVQLHSRPPPLLATFHASRRPRSVRAVSRLKEYTTGELILLHLDRHRHASGPATDGRPVPVALTQEGIGGALGVSQARLAAPLQRLVQRGLVRTTVSRVEGSERRRKSYVLTSRGISRVRELEKNRRSRG